MSSPGWPRPKGSRGDSLPTLSRHSDVGCGIFTVSQPWYWRGTDGRDAWRPLGLSAEWYIPAWEVGIVWGYRHFDIENENEAEEDAGLEEVKGLEGDEASVLCKGEKYLRGLSPLAVITISPGHKALDIGISIHLAVGFLRHPLVPSSLSVLNHDIQ